MLLQLGDQLIKNESIALVELVKNAYDADASNVTIIMDKIHDINTGEIIHCCPKQNLICGLSFWQKKIESVQNKFKALD